MASAKVRRIALGIGIFIACSVAFALPQQPSETAGDVLRSASFPVLPSMIPTTILRRQDSCTSDCGFDICGDDPDVPYLCESDENSADMFINGTFINGTFINGTFINGTLYDTPQYSSPRPYGVNLHDGGSELSLESQKYPQGRYLRGDGTDWASSPLDVAFDYQDNTNCRNVEIDYYMYPDDGNYAGWVTEHIIELQTVGMFIESLVTGQLSSTSTSAVRPPISASWFRENWLSDSLPTGLGTIGGGIEDPQKPNTRVFEALGSVSNRDKLVLAGRNLNLMKAIIWRGFKPRAQEKFDGAVEDWMSMRSCGQSAKFLAYMKRAMAVFNYIGDDVYIKSKFIDSERLVRDQLSLIEEHLLPGSYLPERWTEFICDLVNWRLYTTNEWLKEKAQYIQQRLDDTYEGDRPPDWWDVVETLAGFKAQLLSWDGIAFSSEICVTLEDGE